MCCLLAVFLAAITTPADFVSTGTSHGVQLGEAPALEPGAVPALFEEGFSTVAGKYLEIFPVKPFWFLALDQRCLARWPVGWIWCLLQLHPSCRTGHGRKGIPWEHRSTRCSELSLEPSAVCSCWAAAGRAGAL